MNIFCQKFFNLCWIWTEIAQSLSIWVDLREKKSGRERNLDDLPILLVELAPTG